ncbi:hypothetical protein B0J13DRAFT_653714 [Dactylonectria estremocensis]|uniref:Uncharacterized protein n=1 Tax=Dactylonectria estremocensis TaxID=1079267 RepID=A0A9P9ICI1_9HYPO|nr:hypothetical protein B0J13DRAFT_653714 [Dactylonectria estremocensis]
MTTENLLADSQTSFKDDSAAQTIGIQIVYCLANASEMASGRKKYNVTVSIEIGSSKIQAAYWINDNDKASKTIGGGTEGNGLQRITLLPLRALCENEIRACYSGREDAIAGIKQALDSRLLEDRDVQRLGEALGYTEVGVRTVVRRIYELAKATVDSRLSSEIGDNWNWSKTVLVVPVLWTQADEQSAVIQKLLEGEAEVAGIPSESIEFESDVEAVLAAILQNRLTLFPELKHKPRVGP